MTVPLSVDSNVTGLSFAEETALKVLSGTPTFFALEPNSFADFGGKFSQVARDTINASRQRLKGTITDLEASAGFQSDFTQTNLQRILQGFFWASMRETPDTFPLNGTIVAITSVSVAGSVTTFNAAGGLGSLYGAGGLLLAVGFAGTLNTGLLVASGGSATTATVARALTVESSPPVGASLKTVGFQAASGDLTLSVNSGIVSILSTAATFTGFGLIPGQWIFIGGDSGATQFVNAANTGYARISAVTAHSLTFDIVLFAAVNDAGTAKTVQLFFSDVLKNELPGAIVRRSYTLERTLGNDGTGVQAEYILGAIPNQLTVNIAAANKVTADLTFVGMDYVHRDGAQGVLASGTRINVPTLGEAAFNTSQNVYATRLFVLNPLTSTPTPLYAYADDIKVTINNEVKGNKAIGTLGSIEATSGDFSVSGSVTAYFSSVDSINAIRNNASCDMCLVLAQNNSGMVLDFPYLTLGNGLNKVEKNKAIMVDLTTEAAMSPNGYTAMACFFTYLPLAAMPV